MKAEVKPLFYLDVLRAVAAIAVVVIHVLGPYRQLYGQIPMDQWFTATSFNAASRWAVPVFILITGGLFLSDPRPIRPGYFIRRRLAKVLVPFLFWSGIYALLAGLQGDFGYQPAVALETLEAIPVKASWYHLGFYYYFIPLYFLIPVLKPLVQSVSSRVVLGMIAGWLLLSLSYFLRIDNILQIDLLLYGGYLILGYYLMNYDLSRYRPWIILGGIAAIIATQGGVYWLSTQKERYSMGLFLSYQTPNVIMVATMVFVLAKSYGDRLTGWVRQGAAILSRYSLGIYLLHPLILWTIYNYDLYFGHPLFAIPFLTAVTLVLTLILVRGLSSLKLMAWTVP